MVLLRRRATRHRDPQAHALTLPLSQPRGGSAPSVPDLHEDRASQLGVARVALERGQEHGALDRRASARGARDPGPGAVAAAHGLEHHRRQRAYLSSLVVGYPFASSAVAG